MFIVHMFYEFVHVSKISNLATIPSADRDLLVVIVIFRSQIARRVGYLSIGVGGYGAEGIFVDVVRGCA
jgi:hypothetical protein